MLLLEENHAGVHHQLLKNSKQKTTNTGDGLSMTEKLDVMFEILYKLGLLGPIRDPKTMMSH